MKASAMLKVQTAPTNGGRVLLIMSGGFQDPLKPLNPTSIFHHHSQEGKLVPPQTTASFEKQAHTTQKSRKTCRKTSHAVKINKCTQESKNAPKKTFQDQGTGTHKHRYSYTVLYIERSWLRYHRYYCSAMLVPTTEKTTARLVQTPQRFTYRRCLYCLRRYDPTSLHMPYNLLRQPSRGL